jgi:hypothetical protein
LAGVSRDHNHTAADAPRPVSLDPEELGFRLRRPVRWLGPVLLAATGARVALADQFGAYLDKRELQSALPAPDLDHSSGEEMWLDYVADVGDGFDATYSVAYLLAQPNLDVDGHALPRGDALVFGGDQVYPTPSGDAYEDRFRGPYRSALPWTSPDQPRPTLYALPGNHDWYDGLTAFLRVFARREAHVGAWQTAQSRSYFALRLPHRWWLFAIDAQEASYLDDPQLEYFRTKVRDELADGDRVILCTANPAWVQAHDRPNLYDTTDYFVRTIIGQEGQDGPGKEITVPLMLSGDWHHYARYSGEQRQLITAGIGGAYLYGTHELPKKIEVPPPASIVRSASRSDPYELRTTFPSARASRLMGAGVFYRLPFANWGFMFLVGFIQALLLVGLDNSGEWIPSLPGVLMIGVVFAVTIFFAVGLVPGTQRPRHFVAGVLHGAAQVALAAAAVPFWRWLPFDAWPRPLPDLAAVLIYGPVAAVVATEIFALYLFLASRFGINMNELFAGQGIERYKGFLRLHIATDGVLTIYPVGVEGVSHRWRANPGGAPGASWIEPVRPLQPHLIEPPIRIGAPIVIPAARPSTQDAAGAHGSAGTEGQVPPDRVVDLP